jgi:hypothetical protein
MSNRFQNLDYKELHTLQRVFLEAKFNRYADDEDLQASETVNSLFKEVIDALVVRSLERWGAVERERMDKWLQLTEDRDEWKAALTRIRSHSRWRIYDTGEKEAYVHLILSPFVVVGEDRILFFEQCEHLHR